MGEDAFSMDGSASCISPGMCVTLVDVTKVTHSIPDPSESEFRVCGKVRKRLALCPKASYTVHMPTSETPPRGDQFPEQVLFDYLLDRVDPETRARIAEQRKIIGSPVQLWFAKVMRMLNDPLNIHWSALADDKQSDA